MTVKIGIGLDGGEEVKSTLADLGKAGEDLVKKLNNLGGSNNPALQKFVQDVKSASGATTEHGKSVEGLTRLYHIFAPAVKQAGASMGEFRGFAIAARLGVGGLALAITGTLLVALGKMSEKTNEVKQRLTLLFDSAESGKKAFDGLADSAAKFGTTSSSIGPTFEEFLRTINNFQAQARSAAGGSKFIALNPADIPGVQSIETQKKAFDGLFGALRAGGASEEVANKAMIEFLNTIQSNGRKIAELRTELEKTADVDLANKLKEQIQQAGDINGAFVEKILRVAPGALKPLEDALGKGKLSAADLIVELDKAPVSLDKFLTGLVRVEPETTKAFDARPIRSFSENISESSAKIQRGVESSIEQASQSGKEAETQIQGVFSELTIGSDTTFQKIKNIFSQNPFDTSTWSSDFFRFFSDIEAGALATWSKIKNAFSQQIQFNAGSPDVLGFSQGFATGGLFRGRPGRDTNLAWLTDKEYILRPEATRYWGVDFLNAINSLRDPSGFANGGLFRAINRSMSIPAFAGGGLNVTSSTGPGGTPFTLIIGNETFTGLSVAEESAERLMRFSRKRKRASSGRAPSRVGLR